MSDENNPLAEWGYRNPSELLHTVDWYRQLRLQMAREDPNEFIEYVLRDEATNEPVKQAPIHEKMQATLNENDRCIIWAHIEAAKTSNVSIGRVLFEIGKNPNIRIGILSNTMRQSQKILRSISQYIERPGPIHEVFPKLQPGPRWNATSITVDRDSTSKDPTVQALGAGVGSVLGARLDLVVIDDVLTIDNTRTEQQRTNLREWYTSNIAGRLVKNGRIWVVGTAFHPDDLLHWLAKNPQFKWVRFPVIDEFNRISWPERWPLERIKAKELEVGPHEAARQLYCRALDDSEARFKREWIEVCLKRGMGKKQAYALQKLPPGYKTVTGVDLGVSKKASSDLTVLFTIIVHPNGDKEVLSIESGRWTGPDILERIVDTQRRFESTIIVENNQAQQFIVDFVKASNIALPIMSFTTGKNKHDVNYGVESMATELSKGQWIIPSVDGLTPASKEISAWISELLFYSPASHTGDRLMASWIAREGARLRKNVVSVRRIDTMSR